MKLLMWAPVQYGYGPYKKWKLGCTHTEMRECEDTDGRRQSWQAKESGLRRNKAVNTLISDFWLLEFWENKFCLFNAPNL